MAGQGIEPTWLLTSHVDVTVSYFLLSFVRHVVLFGAWHDGQYCCGMEAILSYEQKYHSIQPFYKQE